VSDDGPLGQDEVERLLAQARAGAAPPPPATPKPVEAMPSAALDQSEIEALFAGGGPPAPEKPKTAAATHMEGLLNKAQQALASVDEPRAPTPLPPGVKPFEYRNLAGRTANPDSASLDLLRDVQLDLKIELGRTHMQLEDVLQLKSGAVVTLDKLAGDPVDIYANGRLIARGEVLVMNDNFCVRVAELVAGENSLA
jgi:flagellar motor switch protein FliN/FliY